MVREEGAASILVDLTDGIISVYHGTDKTLLFKKKAKKGDWNRIWKAIESGKARRLYQVM